MQGFCKQLLAYYVVRLNSTLLGCPMSGQQGVNRALYQLAGRSLADSQYAMAIRCLLAVLENDPDPDDFAQCSLDLARIYIDYTEDTHQAQEKLLQLHVRIKDHSHRLDQKCSCCSLLVKAAMKASDGAAAAKACTKALKILGRARGPAAELEPWWLHFGCQAASMAQLNSQDWHKLAAKALSEIKGNQLLSAQLLCAVLQAQLSSAKPETCVSTLRSLQQAISGWPTDPEPQVREIQAHALTLQALLMSRESQAGCCWDIPVCRPSADIRANEVVAGGSDGDPRGQNGAAAQRTAEEATVGPVLSAVLDELQEVQNLTGTEKTYGWLCVRSQVALLMLLRATDVLAQNSAGKDGSKNTAIFYAEAGLGLLAESDDVEKNPTLLDLRVLLESVSFLFHITAFSGKAKDSHLTSAQTALAALQSHTPTTSTPCAPAVHAASSSKATAAASKATPPVSDANEQPCAAAGTFARYCTAMYAMTMGDMHAAAKHLRTGISVLQTLQASRSRKGGSKGVLPGLQMLSALLTTALCNALSDIGTAETQAEVTGLLSGLQSLLEGDGRDASSFKLESFLAALSRARSLRPGAEASSHLEKRAPRWQDHKDAVLKAFELSSRLMVGEFTPGSTQQVPGKRQQLVISALRNLGPVLASEGDGPGVDKVLKHALQLLNVAPDGTARVAVLREYVKHCLPEDSERRAPAVARVQAYSDAIASSSGTEHAALLKWGLGADEV